MIDTFLTNLTLNNVVYWSGRLSPWEIPLLLVAIDLVASRRMTFASLPRDLCYVALTFDVWALTTLATGRFTEVFRTAQSSQTFQQETAAIFMIIFFLWHLLSYLFCGVYGDRERLQEVRFTVGTAALLSPLALIY